MCKWKRIPTTFGGKFRDAYDELAPGATVAIQLLGVAYDSDGYRTILVESDDPAASVDIKVTAGDHEPRRAVRHNGRRVTTDSPAAYLGQPLRLVPDDGEYWTLSCDPTRCAECLHESRRCAGYQECWWCHVERHESEACRDDFLTCTWCNKDRHDDEECGKDPRTCFTCREAVTQAA